MNRIYFIFVCFSLLQVNLFAQLDRSIIPQPGPAPIINLGEPQSFQLDNGLQVFVVEDHKLPIVDFSLLVDVDPYLEGSQVGLLEAVGELMRAGTANKSKAQIDEAIDFIGANLTTLPNQIYASSLSKHQDSLLELMSEIVLTPNFSQEELDKFKNQKASTLQVRLNNPNAVAGQLSDAMLYGKDHPYGEILTAKTLDNITLEACRKYFLTYFRPEKAYLVVVGDMTFETVKRKVKTYFGEWKAKPIPSHTYEQPKAPQERKIALIDFPNAVQSSILVGHPIDYKPGSPDAFALSLANMILGNGASGRLFTNLRETHGWTYGAYSSVAQDRLVGEFIASTSVRNAVTDSAIVEILAEITRIREELITEEELQAAKNNLIGSFIRRLEDPQTIAQFALQIKRFDLPKDYYSTYLKKISAVQIEDVQAAANKYFSPDQVHIVVVGKAKDIASSLEAIGPVTYYDKEATPIELQQEEIPTGLSPEQIMQRYFAVMGGKPAIDAIKDASLVYHGKAIGSDLKLEIFYKSPMYFKREMDTGGFVQSMIYNGKAGQMQGANGKRTMSEQEMKATASEVQFIPLQQFDPNTHQVKLLRLEKDQNEKMAVVQLTNPMNKPSLLYFSVASGLLKKKKEVFIAPDGQSFTKITKYEHYQEVEGIKIVSKIVETVGNQQIELTAAELKLNTGLKKSLFKVEQN